MTEDDTPEPDEIGRWLAYELRKAAWVRDNPGAYPSERANFEASLREELGL